jgi:hypothetical protein
MFKLLFFFSQVSTASSTPLSLHPYSRQQVWPQATTGGACPGSGQLQRRLQLAKRAQVALHCCRLPAL